MSQTLKHICCVDDEKDILEIIHFCLTEIGGFDVTCINDSQEAIRNIATIAPDLILLDVMMPHLDGPTAFKSIRKIESLQHTPIIFMTAKIQKAEIQAYMDLGAAGVISKPFEPMTLADTVSEIWSNAQGLPGSTVN